MAKRVGSVVGRQPERGSKEAFWRGHLARQPHSGLSIRAYCARHGLSEASFYFWRRELARRNASPVQRPRFVPVTVGVGVPSSVEFQLSGGVVIRVPAHDREALVAVWELVKGASCSV
jgi:hypothetical protein